MKTVSFFLIIFLGITGSLQAQISISTTSSVPDASSMLDVVSTTKGFLAPRMTQAQRLSISTPAIGLMVYQTDGSAGLYTYNGSSWTWVGGSNLTGSGISGQAAFWTGTGSFAGSDHFFWDNSNSRLGIGTTNPQYPIHLTGNSNITQLAIQASAAQTNDNPLMMFMNSAGIRLLDLHSDDFRNVFLGVYSGAANTPAGTNGIGNTFVGSRSGYANSSGYSLTFTGAQAGFSNTSGFQLTFTGYQAGYSNTTGNYNTAYGMQSLYSSTTGNFNTAIGTSALMVATGSKNTAVGHSSGGIVSTGIENVLLGSNADVGSGDYTNTIAVGYNTKTTASNQVRLGDNRITSLYCQGAYNATTASIPNMFVNSSGQIMRSTTSIPTGTGGTGQVAYWTATSALSSSPILFWDNANTRLGIGTSAPGQSLTVEGTFGIRETGTTPTYHTIFRGGNQAVDITYTLPVDDGNNGQSLTTDGSGILSWTSSESPLTFSSGLTRSVDVIKWGGSLTENTLLTQSGTQTLTFSNTGSSATTFNLSGTGDFQIQDNGTTFFVATDGGNLGIGITSPASMLHLKPSTAAAFQIDPFGTASGNTGESRFLELAANGANYVGFKAPNSITANIIWTLPPADGVNGQVLSTNGSGVMSWADNEATTGSGVSGQVTFWDGSTSLTGSANLFWNTTYSRLGIGTSAPASLLHLKPTSASALQIDPYGTASGNTGELHLLELAINGTNYAGFKSPNSIPNNIIWILPGADGTLGQVLSTNGSGTLSWASSEPALTFGNGLTRSINNITLGGALTGNTTITQDGTETLTFTNAGTSNLIVNLTSTGDFEIQDYGSAFFAATNNGDIGIGTQSPGGRLHITGNENAPQVIIQAHSTQSNTNPLLQFRKSDGTVLSSFHSDHITNVFLGYNAGSSNYSTTGLYNLFAGAEAGKSNTFGYKNTFAGDSCGYSNVAGTRNAVVGASALFTNTGGDYNTACGYQALYNTNGNNSTAVGYQALFHQSVYSSITDDNNTAVGFQALYSASTTNGTNGRYNVAVGHKAMLDNTTGANSTAVGCEALTNNLTSVHVTALGYQALYSLTASDWCTAVGSKALFTLNGSSSINPTENTAVGYEALYYTNPTSSANGWYNTGIGCRALRANTTGSSNTAAGWVALNLVTTGNYNTGCGSTAGNAITTGSGNTCIGAGSDVASGGYSNVTAIGSGVIGSASNQVRIGDASVTSLYCMGANGTVSSGNQLYVDGVGKIGYLVSSARYKEAITDMDDIAWIYLLRPVNFVLKSDDLRKRQYGLIAEEVETVNPDMVNYNREGVVETVSYTTLITPMLKALQEQQTAITILQTQVSELQKDRDQMIRTQELLISRLAAMEQQRIVVTQDDRP